MGATVKHDGPTWDTTTDPANPQPLLYPICPGCNEAWHYVRALDFMKGDYTWAWMKPPKERGGCGHKYPPEWGGGASGREGR